ncbi:MAG: class I SAM-dependent methyltransferase [Nitrospirae bacterium]|nr:MAG: class I SAM-dependent methyltransferase [Nitrospirota bacterium]
MKEGVVMTDQHGQGSCGVVNDNELRNQPSQEQSDSPTPFESRKWKLSARLEPFDSFWQTPKDIEKGYRSFFQYYKHNYLPHLPSNRQSRILVISCGPGYLVKLLNDQGYHNVLGIDSDPEKIEYARKRNLPCEVHEAFPYLQDAVEAFDVIIPEQELNHLTLNEILVFLKLCWRSLRPNGTLIVYGLNGANPLVGSENLAHNIDHFNTFTEYSLRQILVYSGFANIKVFPLKLYVFWTNPLNYVGLVTTTILEAILRVVFLMYGKSVKILTKKIAAVCRKF